MRMIVLTGRQKPKGLCGNTQKPMMEYGFTLPHGSGNSYDDELKEKAFIACATTAFARLVISD